MEGATTDAVESKAFDAAVLQWIKESFTGEWKPSIEMVKMQLSELYKIDSVNRLKEVSEKGGLQLLESQYFDALHRALNDVESEKLKSCFSEA